MKRIKSKFFQGLASSSPRRSGLASIRRGISLSRSGSVLVYALMVLSLILIVTLSLSAVTVIERKSSSVTGKSTVSFQAADSGVEIISQIIYSSDSMGTVYNAFVGIPKTPPLAGDLCNPFGSPLAGTLSDTINGRDYVVTLYDSAGSSAVKIDCNDNGTTTGYTVAFIKKIQSIGIYSGTTRAVETAIAAGSSYKGCALTTVPNNSAKKIPLVDSANNKLCEDINGCIIRIICAPNSTSPKLTTLPQFFYQNSSKYWSKSGNASLGFKNGDATITTVISSANVCSSGDIVDDDPTNCPDVGGDAADNLCINNTGAEIWISVCD